MQSQPVTPEDLRSYLLIAGLIVGWAAQMIYVAYKYGLLVGKVEQLTNDVNGLGRKFEQHAHFHEQQTLAERRQPGGRMQGWPE